MLAQAFQVDIGAAIGVLAALGIGAFQYLMRGKIENVDASIKSLQHDVHGLRVDTARHAAKLDEHHRRLDRQEER
jgi:L-cysteine desulfidase